MIIDKTGTIVVLTGAGISAESGIPTFRGGSGLWNNHRIEDVASPEGFAKNPDLVQQFYNSRRRELASVHPNDAHKALAKLAANWDGDFLLVTQNIDDLHDRCVVNPKPGFKLVHMHGELNKSYDLKSQMSIDQIGDITDNSIRPYVVWFGEYPLHMDVIEDHLTRCDLFVSIGTSGNVYPAASFTQLAKKMGAITVQLNLEPSWTTIPFDRIEIGTASKIVPSFVEELLQ